MGIVVERYNDGFKREWDAFVEASRNGTFLFKRGYMDYHSDRFTDCSWVALKGNKPVALLPANLDPNGILHSHQGLTYGGWILPQSHLDGEDLLEIFQLAISQWKKFEIKGLRYKALPYIYAARPSQEDIYALFRLGAEICETNLSMAIDMRAPGAYNKLRKRKLAETAHLIDQVEEMASTAEFMKLTQDCLRKRYSASPVHSTEEITLLHNRFPENIRFFCIRGSEGNPAAGVCIYDTGIVAHTQYIATDEEGRERDLLTPLFTRLIRKEFAHCRYFDFGTSNEEHGMVLNNGLLRQKASFGATGVAYPIFSIKI